MFSFFVGELLLENGDACLDLELLFEPAEGVGGVGLDLELLLFVFDGDGGHILYGNEYGFMEVKI